MSFAGPGVRRGDPCESFPTLDIPILYKYLCEDRPFYSNKKPISEAVGHVSVSPTPTLAGPLQLCLEGWASGFEYGGGCFYCGWGWAVPTAAGGQPGRGRGRGTAQGSDV